MPIIEELDEEGNVLNEEEDNEEENDEEGKRRWREKLAAMEEEEKARVAKQFAMAEEQRVAGNKLLSEADYEGACKHYDQALKDLQLVGNEPDNRARAEQCNMALHSNMALAKLKLNQFEEVKHHAGLALADPSGSVEAQRELQKLRADLRTHERDLAKKQKETWGQVFGGRTVVEGEEDAPLEGPPAMVRACKNSDKHLIVSAESASVSDGKGSTLLSAVDMQLREGWCIGVVGGSIASRTALGRLFAGEMQVSAGNVVVHPKPPKPGRGKQVEPIDRTYLAAGAVLLLALLAATEFTEGVPRIQVWIMRVVASVFLLLIRMAWKFTTEAKAPLTVNVAFATADSAVLKALRSKDKVEDLLGSLLARQLPAAERRERVVALLAAAGFQGTGEAGGSPAKFIEAGLTFGQLPQEQQRLVQILRCIAMRPEVIVCDGALEGLDVDCQARILRMLKRMKQECKTSILCMSSDLEQVCYVADSLAVLSSTGELCEKGPTQELLQTPRHEETSAAIATVLDRTGQKTVGGAIQARCKELLGNADLDGPWIPPIYK
eukprot:CAMPEP_0115456318 /NCGR_PEP_ID=MMETSP0271-20121206/44624_1 /TAXON_ID=71861 /ORGANISM="Scrippsiella trochoidea, Strain CCMP3099" /LENGTH=550 /DNA_ID=CAMNT_0002882825 /DNA_START=44 /DNA_END=1696 /DNA_ORIENTATION=+